MTDGIFRRRRLPHWDVEGKPIFITACLEGSIPAGGMHEIHCYRQELDARRRPEHLSPPEWEHHKDKLLFARIDDLLDHESPVKHLADDQQSEIVENAFLHFAGERYMLLAFVVMPSHHHWMFVPDENWSREAVRQSIETRAARKTPRELISQSIQSYTATKCNRLRGESGRYWQAETFDHWARDDDEMLRIIAYIENNPVKAGLVKRPEDWRWSSARLRAMAGVRPGEAILKPVG